MFLLHSFLNHIPSLLASYNCGVKGSGWGAEEGTTSTWDPLDLFQYEKLSACPFFWLYFGGFALSTYPPWEKEGSSHGQDQLSPFY